MPPKPRARAAAEMMRKLKLQAAANVTPVRAMSCTRAEQREVACAAQAEGESSSRDYERTEAAGGGESVTPVRAMSCTRAEQCKAACAA